MWKRFSISLVLTAALALAACVSAPVQQMSDARQAITAAEVAGADDFAPQLMQESRELLERAEREISEERFAAARYHAVEARQRALKALAAEPDPGE